MDPQSRIAPPERDGESLEQITGRFLLELDPGAALGVDQYWQLHLWPRNSFHLRPYTWWRGKPSARMRSEGYGVCVVCACARSVGLSVCLFVR